MSGILEQSIQRIEALEGAVKQLVGIVQGMGQTTAPAAVPVAYTPAVAEPVAAAPANAFGIGLGTPTPAAAPTVTPEMIQTLIMPLLQNEQIKAELSKQMQAMGIANLPDATPAQLPELYQRFTAVRDHFANTAPAAQAVSAAPSII